MTAMVEKILITSALVMTILSFITATAPSSVIYKEKQKENIFRIIRYEWTIENLHFNDFVQNQSLISNKFSQWYLSLYPKGHAQANKDYVSLFLVSAAGNISANFRFGFMNARNEEILPWETYEHFSETEEGWGNLNFAQLDFVTNEKNGLFINNSLTVFSEIKTNISINQDLLDKIEPLPLKDDLGTNLEVLLDNELFSDVIISSGGKNFSAHKAVLAARCPLFKDMFQNDIQVRNTSWFNMTDVDSEVMDEMLRYIYTGKVSNLEELGPNLLPEAERCEWVRLKTLCEHSISSKLSIDNAVEYYILGDMYSAVYLKDHAKNFIAAHAWDVMDTSEFQSLYQTHNLLLKEELLPAIVKALTAANKIDIKMSYEINST